MSEFQNIHTGAIVEVVGMETVSNIPPVTVLILGDGTHWEIGEFSQHHRTAQPRAAADAHRWALRLRLTHCQHCQ